MTRARSLARIAALEEQRRPRTIAENSIVAAMRAMNAERGLPPPPDSWPASQEYVDAWAAEVGPRQAALLARDPLSPQLGDDA